MNDPSKNAAFRISRHDLHRRVWQLEPQALANELGITPSRLVEICNQMAVPYPRRRYWQRIKEGKSVVAFDLPERPVDAAQFVVIDPTKERVPTTVAGWHPLIAAWKRQRAEAMPKHSQLPSALDWSPAELRILKFINTIFRAVEKHGFVPKDSRRWRKFSFEYRTVEISCSLRERNHRLREQKAATGESFFTLKPTGEFIFRIESYLGPVSSIRCEWTDRPPKYLEEMAPDIIAALLEAGPVLLLRKHEEEEKLRQHFKDKELKEFEAKRTRIDQRRWAALVEYAQRLLIAEQVEKLLNLLESRADESSTSVEGREISDWLQWARSRLETFDPRSLTANLIFADIAHRGDEDVNRSSAVGWERS